MGIAADLAQRLAERAQDFCLEYLRAGQRAGRYWIVGDVLGTPGRSLHVRLTGPTSGRGAAGKWVDQATGEHGDLLDLLALNQDLRRTAEIFDEARRFLSLPAFQPTEPQSKTPHGSSDAARRLWAASSPLSRTLAQTYLRSRGIVIAPDCPSLRFHPGCFYRSGPDDPPDRRRTAWPAMIAAVTAPDGRIAGIHRTWLGDDGRGKAPVATPRRALGELRSHAVRFGRPGIALAAGEGLETMLSVRTVLPGLPLAACLSAAHLAAFDIPHSIERLYLVRDRDPAGAWATTTLGDRARALGITSITLDPEGGDLNDDLVCGGADRLHARLCAQLNDLDLGHMLD